MLKSVHGKDNVLLELRDHSGTSSWDHFCAIIRYSREHETAKTVFTTKHKDIILQISCLLKIQSGGTDTFLLGFNTIDDTQVTVSMLADHGWEKYSSLDTPLELMDLAIYWNTKDLNSSLHRCRDEEDRVLKLFVLFLRRGQRTRQLRSLEFAIEYGKRLIQSSPDNHSYMAMIGVSHQQMHNISGTIDHIHSAIAWYESALQLASAVHPNRHTCLVYLSVCYLYLAQTVGGVGHARQATNYMHMATEFYPDGHEIQISDAISLGYLHVLFFMNYGQIENLQQAVSCLGKINMDSLRDHPDQNSLLFAFGWSQAQIFIALGEVQNLDIATDALDRAAALSDDVKSHFLIPISEIDMELYNRLGKLEYLLRYIRFLERYNDLNPEDIQSKPSQFFKIGYGYILLYERVGEIEYLHKAVECLESVKDYTQEEFNSSVTYLCLLGKAYQLLASHDAHADAVNKAIGCFESAMLLQSNEGCSADYGTLFNLGALHRLCYRHSNGTDHLLRAYSCYNHAFANSQGRPLDKLQCLEALADCRREMYHQLGETNYIYEAAELYERAIDSAPDIYKCLATMLLHAGYTYQELHKVSADDGYLLRAKDSFKRAAQLSVGEPVVRLKASEAWAESSLTELLQSVKSSRCIGSRVELTELELSILSKALGAPELSMISDAHKSSECLEAWCRFLALLPEVIWVGSSAKRRFELLGLYKIQRLTARATFIAALSKHPALAFEWFDRGRCLLWSQMLELRAPAEELRVAAPHLAHELERVSLELERIAVSQPSSVIQSQLADRRDRIIAQIKSLPEHRSLPAPLGERGRWEMLIGEQWKQLPNGIFVALNATESSCDAILYHSTKECSLAQEYVETKFLRLKGVSEETAKRASDKLAACLRTQGSSRGFKKSPAQAESSFKDILAMLWYDIVEPILHYLDIEEVLPADQLPHITWCTTGALSFLPIHAAGVYDNPKTILSNFAVSSYAPNLFSISRSASSPNVFSGILGVGHRDPLRGMSALPKAKDELEEIRRIFQGLRCTTLEEEEATAAAVLQAMSDHSCVHFACHASQDTRDPLQSCLHLHDQDLDLATISQHTTSYAQLAFLSACHTAAGDSMLPDEVIHLAGGLMMAGYAHVIATMWSVNDNDAPIVAAKVYECMLQDGVLDHQRTALALHMASVHLRNTIGIENYSRWVPYIHLGTGGPTGARVDVKKRYGIED
ncbi:CHAT domain protein [Ceratobasidium sp. AG-Ba]|nr:CHAT domain protein [Ceratobasidium sp. AG-Ba]